MAKKASLAELRQKYLRDGAAVPSSLVSTLEADGRAGALALAKAIKSRQAGNRSEGQRLRHMLKQKRYPTPGPGPNYPWPPV